ncbi:hypothetical protein D3C78_847990 [compost metagenome]
MAARDEPAGQPPHLTLAVLLAGTPNARLETLPALPLMPDIPHARLLLEGAHCERLPGDGWDAYCKPFRTLEDLHVLAALGAWLYGVGLDSGWPRSLSLRLIGLLAGCAEASRQPASSAATHVLLAGLFAQFEALSTDLDAAFAQGPAEWAALWKRDRGVLGIAGSARAKRLERALGELGIDLGK